MAERMALLALMALLLQSAWSWPWESYWANRQGLEAFSTQKYATSSRYFEKALRASPQDPRLHYNLGNARHQEKQFSSAIEAYRQALRWSEDSTPQERATTYYNLGNSYFRLGQEGEPEAQWKQAVEAYDRALELNPNDTDATQNRKFVAQQLEQLKQQKNPNPSQGEDPQGGKGKGQNGNNPPPEQPNPGSEDGKNSDDSGNTAADQPPPEAPPPAQPFREEDITGALQSLEQDERNHRNGRYFQRYPNQPSAPEQNLFNLSPEELMSLSPEELQQKLQGNSPSARDW